MSELRRRDVTVSVLVEVTQSLDEVVCGVGGPRFADGLVNRQENFEADSFVGFVLMSELLDVRLGGILSESSQGVANLRDVDLSVAAAVEQLKRLLEFWKAT